MWLTNKIMLCSENDCGCKCRHPPGERPKKWPLVQSPGGEWKEPENDEHLDAVPDESEDDTILSLKASLASSLLKRILG